MSSRRGSDVGVGRPVAQFALTGFVALLLVGIAVGFFLRREATIQAVATARDLTRVTGTGVVEPVLTDAIVASDRAAVAALDRVVRARVLREPVVRVKLWTLDGRIVYSDEPRLIGDRFELADEDLEAVRDGRVEAETTDLTRQENRFERAYHSLIEVYMPVHTPSGTPLMFETYIRASALSADANRLWLPLIPLLLGALVLLELILIPLAYSLARRVREGRRHEEVLLRRAVESSNNERRSIAADLHDGVVQELAALSYQLEASARQGSADASTLRSAADTTRGSIASLRSLLVEIYPPNLRDAGLEAALQGLVSSVRSRGFLADLTYSASGVIGDDAQALLFRAAQEALRNAVAHAKAKHITVAVSTRGDVASLDVVDDGRGFVPSPDGGPPGHFGLRLLAELAEEAGGTCNVTSTPGEGTHVHVEIPA